MTKARHSASTPAGLAQALPIAASTRSGMLFMIAAMLMLPGIDAVAKLLAGTVSSGQIAWSRFFSKSCYWRRS